MDKKNAWKVEPKLIDRFLEVLADNDFRWVSGCRANKFNPVFENDTLVFIEKSPKKIGYMRYSFYLNHPDGEYNITEVTEEWLRDRENEEVTSLEGDSVEELISLVENWAHEKEIDDYKNWEKQFMKFQEEAIELHTEMVLRDEYFEDECIDFYIYDKNYMKLEMGDVLVTLIVLAKQQDIELSECLRLAWNKIKNRRGKTIDGKFVKEEY